MRDILKKLEGATIHAPEIHTKNGVDFTIEGKSGTGDRFTFRLEGKPDGSVKVAMDTQTGFWEAGEISPFMRRAMRDITIQREEMEKDAAAWIQRQPHPVKGEGGLIYKAGRITVDTGKGIISYTESIAEPEYWEDLPEALCEALERGIYGKD